MKFPTGEFVLGDCLERMQDIPDGAVDMILCDLPYGTTQNKWDTVIPFEPLWEQYWRVAKPNAAIVLTASQPFAAALICSQMRNFKYDWIWDKIKGTGFLNAKKMPMRNHEHVLVFYKSPPTYNPQKTTDHKRKVSFRSVRHQAGESYGGVSRDNLYDSTERYPRSIQVFSTDTQNSSLHPTQKPVALFEYLIKTYTNEGDLVLDNCSGSGTTAVAAHTLNRRWLCIEKETDYYWTSVIRMLDVLEKPK